MGLTAGMEEMFLGAVTVGERGQIVVPAEAREQMGLAPGDKLLAFLHPSGEMVCLCKLSVLERAREFLSRVQTEQKAESEDDKPEGDS